MKKQEEISERVFIITTAFVFVFLSVTGGSTDFSAALFSAVAAVLLLIIALRQKKWNWTLNVQTVGVALLPVAYAFTAIYAVDTGIAVYGIVKFLPAALLMLLVMQLTAQQRQRMLIGIPFAGAILTFVTAPTYFLNSLKDYFYTYDRLHGGFLYANSFALFLLCGIVVILLTDFTIRYWLRYAATLVLLSGIVLSGSRAVLMLTALVLVAVFLLNRKTRKVILIAGAAGVAALAGYILIPGKGEAVAHLLTNPFSAGSSLYDRLLYVYDALPVVLKHPFGLGYKGYQYLHPYFKTGMYSVTYVHCDYLQLMLDIGWIPAILFFVGFFKNFFSKIPVMNKILLGVIALHIAVDFDLQFLAVFAVLILAMDYESGKEKEFAPAKKKVPVFAALLLVTLGNLYLMVPSALEYAGKYEAALKLYPNLTLSESILIKTEESRTKVQELAENIVRHNEHIPIAYDALATMAALDGDWETAVENKEKAIANARFTVQEYEDYFNILYRAVNACADKSDREGFYRYAQLMIALPDRMQEVEDSMSTLGKKIQDQPNLTLQEEKLNYIEELKKLLKE